MPRGGYRPNSGAKKGMKYKETIQREAYRKALLDAIYDKKKELADALISKGMTGDVPALKEINERGLGKVPQSLLDPGGEVMALGVLMLPQRNDSKNTLGTDNKAN